MNIMNMNWEHFTYGLLYGIVVCQESFLPYRYKMEETVHEEIL